MAAEGQLAKARSVLDAPSEPGRVLATCDRVQAVVAAYELGLVSPGER